MAAGRRIRVIGLTLAGVAGVAIVAAPAAGAKAKGFELGVASGDVTSGSAILWAKAKKSGTALVQVTDRGGFGKCNVDDASGKLTEKAKKSHDNTVHRPTSSARPRSR